MSVNPINCPRCAENKKRNVLSVIPTTIRIISESSIMEVDGSGTGFKPGSDTIDPDIFLQVDFRCRECKKDFMVQLLTDNIRSYLNIGSNMTYVK